MKINYDSNTENEHDWKVGDVIHNSTNPDSGFYLLAEVTSVNLNTNFYTLINLEDGTGLSISSTSISELQQNYYNKGDKILNGTFKYTDDDK